MDLTRLAAFFVLVQKHCMTSIINDQYFCMLALTTPIGGHEALWRDQFAQVSELHVKCHEI